MNTDAVTEWIGRNAQPVSLDLDAPLDDLDALSDIVAGARVVGMGETTRAGHEVVRLAHRVLRRLVTRDGFRALAIQDDSSVIAELDEHIRTGDGDAAEILRNAWNPWRTDETVEVVDWLRRYNRANPTDPVHLVGLEPPAARLADYDTVIGHVADHAPQRLEELRGHLDVIRSAHQVNEHVQRAHGTHPGRLFVEHARDAAAIVDAVPEVDPRTREAMTRVVDFHANSIAAGNSPGDAVDTAAVIVEYQERTTRKLVYWEGIAHTARATDAGLPAMNERFRTTGAALAEHYGAEYATFAIGFDHGEIHDGQLVPSPPADFVDARFAAGGDAFLLDLRSSRDPEVVRWLDAEQRHRIIAGIYKPEEDDRHYLAGGPLRGWFDAVLRVGEITPTTLLRY